MAAHVHAPRSIADPDERHTGSEHHRRRIDPGELDRVAAIGRIESPILVPTYDPRSGRILSLADRATGHEVLRPRPGLDLVLARTVEERPGRIVLERRFAAPGTRSLIQRIRFDATDPVIRIGIEADLVGEAAPNGLYFALPLAMDPDWGPCSTRRVSWSRPARPGLGDGRVGLGDVGRARCRGAAHAGRAAGPVRRLSFGPPPEAVDRVADPLLLSWVANNSWDTNFPQVQNGWIWQCNGLLALAGPTWPRSPRGPHNCAVPC